jgi:anti-sigma regulatory factor (Ser/Thr protein kinase)
VKALPQSKSIRPQLNLALLHRTPVELPHEQQHELTLALVEMLVNAATPDAACAPAGGPHESKAHE